MKTKPKTINGDLVYKPLDILDGVDGEKDLKKIKLTPYEYQVAKLLLGDYWKSGEAKTFCLSVANFFKKQGFMVEATADGVAFAISSKEIND